MTNYKHNSKGSFSSSKKCILVYIKCSHFLAFLDEAQRYSALRYLKKKMLEEAAGGETIKLVTNEISLTLKT